MAGYSIVTVDADNIETYGLFCVKNRKHPGYLTKRAWLKHRFEEGLRLKLIITEDGRQAGFLEYVPGEHTWRVVKAKGYLVIHCIWVNAHKFPFKGMASDLLSACVRDAEESKKKGLAVVVSDGPWMAGKELFIKNGFELVDEAEPYYQLLVKQVKKGHPPSFPGPKSWKQRLPKSDDLQLIYTNQCPFIGKAVAELPPVAKQFGISLKLIELDNPAVARKRMPSPYGVVSLVYQGRLLVDHPISATRFRNILQKELGLEPPNSH